ncbi:cation-transporting ATPase E [Breznakia sp. PF5-3]|uniref:HAD-IC family P-type ATPase n=1 Tax=unclassified Breznakia TaxID=2623764 RepID=UPI002407736A|nr:MULTISPECIES: HAD-IC family P-type ATPase [unclassified Breznakia]MDF9824038.1 cation-transporting ATPase E [Breznakia sp. PM6-1]MDF9834896.1 cation-transporting ATPase E [Breznakia sp. PF5-3]MDF9837082.1 cation-transporting ATPase E [Breznakia sp. PFB2-8]MDF9859007.1 cation-transporting ATPase E [Breznakia sp. PH5-24]
MKKFNGLTQEEVNKETRLGNVNIPPKPIVKSNLRIILGHVFNLFNAYNFAIAFALIMVKAYSSLFFVIIVLSNTIIRAYQEIRSKNTIAKLNLIVSPKTKVIRNGKEQLLSNDDIVLHDTVYFETGNQISADSIILSDNVEVDESLISGEVEPVLKKVGDTLLSGSFIVSGACYAEVIHVGIDNYAMKITEEARKRKPVSSELMTTFNKVTRFTSFFIIPLCFLMVFQSYVIRHQSIDETVINTATALLGMLPKGLVLLTSVSLAASVVKLGSEKTLVQELFSIETLSRIDVLCLDKTGTLTQGVMKVQDVVALGNTSIDELNDIMSSFVQGARDNNTTYQTLHAHFTKENKYATKDRISFSSARKWSAVQLEGVGAVVVGAPEFILPDYQFSDDIIEQRKQGARVLLVAKNQSLSSLNDDIHSSTAIGVIVISDSLRDDAVETLKFFEDNEVQVKIISGDNPETVSAIAKKAGVKTYDHYLDATTIKDEKDIENAIMNYDVIGRATPYQKHQMILCLQEHGQKIAMTGDGVNDVLALKDADVSIAMGSGSDAARQVAQVVIIDGRLGTLVDIVREGRLVINNITRSASMYYLKTIYTICLAILSVLLNIPYPFIPFQMTLMDMFIEGFPSFMIMFEKNIDKPKESIRNHALRYSLPNAIMIVISVAAIKLLAPQWDLNLNQVFTVLYFTTSFISIQMIYRIYKPINWYRGGVLILDIIGFLISVPIFWNWLEISPVNEKIIIIILVTMLVSLPLISFISIGVNKYLSKTTPK